MLIVVYLFPPDKSSNTVFVSAIKREGKPPSHIFLCTFSGHAEELIWRQNLDSKLPCLCQLASGVLAADQIICLAAHRAAGMSAQRFDFCVDPIAGVWLNFAGHHKGLSDKGIAHIGADRRRLIGLNAHQQPKLRPDRPVFLAAEPLADIPVQCLSEVRELCKIKAHAYSRFKFRKISAEPLADGPAGGAAYHGNIHSSQILLKGGNAAVLDGIPKILPGFLSI